MTDESYHLIGVMGSPVMHSQSPLMHNYWFDQTGLPGKYVYLPLPPERLPAALRALPALNFSGCNLTIPHKLQAMEIVDEVDEVARKIGAISCVVVLEDGSLLGTNNDWLGFLGNLKQSAPDWRANAGPATVIGAGGGSRAVCHALLSEGAQEIRLVNRSNDRAQRLADDIGGPIMVLSWNERHAALDGAATVVNTTSLGMVGQPPLELKLDALGPDAVVADIIYTPLETSFVQAARARGNTAVGGLGMLLHQGPPAWKLWFGLTPDVTPELREMMEASITGNA
ncbi:shikimate dehydrogenase [uncultured Boseongicola sp.]|uniref:shikimate dehydrogenase n=1 Tax=uncultured Boseongicola sp. TaxID=1648499 RepID=UPI002605F348|nr:shikimate dehydrogenase [uncultured Boseongicola sp.]